jgi:hypothetical protein
MMTLEELSRLDYQGAMDLLFAYTTDVKRHEKDIAAFDKEIELWSSRVKLAEAKAMPDLAEAARRQLGQITEKRDSVEASRIELARDVQRLKEALPGIKAKERSIDPDQLLAELSMLTGEAMDPEKAKIDRELSALSSSPSEDTLAALKRKMGLGPKDPSGEPGAGA